MYRDFEIVWACFLVFRFDGLFPFILYGINDRYNRTRDYWCQWTFSDPWWYPDLSNGESRMYVIIWVWVWMNSRSVRNNNDFNIWVTNFTYHHLDNKKLIESESYLPTYGNLILSSWFYRVAEYLEVLLLLYILYYITIYHIHSAIYSPNIILDAKFYMTSNK